MPGPNKKAKSFYTNILRSVGYYKKSIGLREKDNPKWSEIFAALRLDMSQEDVYDKLMRSPISYYFSPGIDLTIYTDQVLNLKDKEPNISEETWLHYDFLNDPSGDPYDPLRFDLLPTMRDIYQESCHEQTNGLCGKIREWMEDINDYAIKEDPKITVFHELLQRLEQQRRNTGLLSNLSLFQSTTTANNQRLYKELMQLPAIKDYFDPSCTGYKLELSFWEALTRPTSINSGCYSQLKGDTPVRLLENLSGDSSYSGEKGLLSIKTRKQREGAPYPTHETYHSELFARELKTVYETTCTISNNDDGLCGKLREFLELMDPQVELNPHYGL